MDKLQEPESLLEPDIDPVPREKHADKGKGKEVLPTTGTGPSEKKHSPFVGFAAGLCSG